MSRAARVGYLRALAGPVRGVLFLIANPGLARFLVFPWLVTLAAASGFAWAAIAHFGRIRDSLWAGSVGGWLGPVHTGYEVALGLALATACLVGGFAVGQVLAAPIYTRLALHTRRRYLGEDTSPAGGLYADVVVPVVVVSGRLVVFCAVQAALLLLNVIPVVGSVANLVLGTAATLFWIALDFFDYPLDSEPKAISLVGRIRYSLSRCRMVMGFATSMLLVFVSLPVVNVFLVPMGVIGATLLYCDDLRSPGA